jgi:dihydroorotase
MQHIHIHRRKFLQTAIGALVCSLSTDWRNLLGAQHSSVAPFDLIVKGGKVVDPSQGISALRDIAISGRKIVRVAQNIDATQARRVLDASGKIVTPGLIDAHTHVYDGVAPLGIPADPNCVAKGVTTAIDAGSSGAHTFPGFRKYIIDVVETRVRVLLNISVVGQSSLSSDNPHGELLSLKHANPKLAIRTIEQNRDVIVGVKVRLSQNIAGDHDMEAFNLAKEAAEAVGLPLMVHIGDTYSPVKSILDRMSRNDLLTHTFHGREGGILDERGKVLSSVRAAVDRGVNLDVGHGAGSFSFEVAEKALEQGVTPGTISSDLHQYNVNGPVYDLATTLSKFLFLGLSLEEVIKRATVNPAALFGFAGELGTLREGAEADVAVFSQTEGDYEFVDAMGAKRMGHQKLNPVATVKAGKIYGSASIPVAGEH